MGRLENIETVGPCLRIAVKASLPDAMRSDAGCV